MGEVHRSTRSLDEFDSSQYLVEAKKRIDELKNAQAIPGSHHGASEVIQRNLRVRWSRAVR